MEEIIKRPGNKSSEFWLVVLVFIVVVANGTAYVEIPMEHIALLAALAGGHHFGRTMIKRTLAQKVQEMAANRLEGSDLRVDRGGYIELTEPPRNTPDANSGAIPEPGRT